MKSTYLAQVMSLSSSCMPPTRCWKHHFPDTQGTLFSRAVEAFYLGSSRGDDRTIAASPPEGPEERRERAWERHLGRINVSVPSPLSSDARHPLSDRSQPLASKARTGGT